MKPIDCGTVREAIAEVVGGRASSEAIGLVERHVTTCEPCRTELALVRLLRATRAEPRAGLHARILRGLAFDRQAMQRPWWALTAAAVAALALGIGFSSDAGVEVTAPAFALEAEAGWALDEGEGLVAGAPVLDDLSDDALEMLLADLSLENGVE